ncbi:CoA-transferase family III domain protein [Cordyceps fumosorosea ARSEF 2679]|uniref:CoA-transferase family III domain protein n=1 Tax=Cordyceps fumosorosea (strain ARSEF 2679) TaxID=1081104 RepID=A0A167N4M0_CORFA|nr:CoA-transferase family III domain protein [Cordyceps fumosorosea ARSEF 2679]OAA55122.1 CoA-transferase family III domain protein [Cordyceps fumosorosea ARSEF 2679]
MASPQPTKFPCSQDIYLDLLSQLGIEPSWDVQIHGNDPIVPSPHRLGDAAATALAALGTSMAALWQQRTGVKEAIGVSVATAIPQLMAVFMTTINGVSTHRLFEDPKLLSTSNFYRAKDDRFVFLLNSYPHLRDINLRVLDCPFETDSFATAIAQWDAFELEERIASLGGTCIAVRTREEWRKSPQFPFLEGSPVIEIEKIGESQPEPLPPVLDSSMGKPLEGVRILDNTHVIAGPMAGRICCEHGAQNLLMSSPDHMDPRAMVTETALGKRSAFCNLDDEADRAKFWEVLRGADVYVSSYLSLDTKGYGPAELIQARPGLVYCDFHGWGKEGPWQQRGGFDQLACSATGFAHEEGSLRSDGRPSLPPTYLLNDYLAAILGAAGIVVALRRRATQGGSYRVHVNLSRVAMWVQSLGMFEADRVAHLPHPTTDSIREKGLLKEVDGSGGRTRYLPTQITYSTGSIKPGFATSSEPTGASNFEFLNN